MGKGTIVVIVAEESRFGCIRSGIHPIDVLPAFEVDGMEDGGDRCELVIDRRVGRIGHLIPLAQFVAVLEVQLSLVVIAPNTVHVRGHIAGLRKIAVVVVGIQHVSAIHDTTVFLVGKF